MDNVERIIILVEGQDVTKMRQKELYESRRLGTPTISHPPTS